MTGSTPVPYSPAASSSSAVPYVVPFAVFMALLGLNTVLPMPALTDQLVRIAVMAAVLYFVARPALDFHVTQ